MHRSTVFARLLAGLGLAATALVARAQPVWQLDLGAAKQGLRLLTDGQAAANGEPNCSVRVFETAAGATSDLIPGVEIGGETFDYGAQSLSHPVSVGVGTVDSSCGAWFGIRGLGTPSVELRLRVFTDHTTLGSTCGYIAYGHAEAAASVPVMISGGDSGAAYQVNYQYQYSAEAGAPWERLPPFYPEDGIICSGGAELSCPIETAASLFSAYFATGTPPERTTAPVTGSGSMIVAPGWSGGGAFPSREPIIFAGLGAAIDDVMVFPAPAGGPDVSVGEFTISLTLTIGPAAASGACCRATSCLVTTPTACASAFGGSYFGDGVACVNPVTQVRRCCPADINGLNGVTVQDIFDFLSAYFGHGPQGDFNASGVVSVQDVFDFLAAYFSGC